VSVGKLQIPVPLTFLTHDAAEGYTEDQATEVFTNHNSHLKFSAAGLLNSDVTDSTLYTGNSQPRMYA